jgi:hypothetical protein
MGNDICGMKYDFIGEDGLQHTTSCILEPSHTSRISEKHQDASGFIWTRNIFAATYQPK